MTSNTHDRAAVLIEHVGNLATAILMLRNTIEEQIKAMNSREEFEGEVLASLEDIVELLISTRSN